MINVSRVSSKDDERFDGAKKGTEFVYRRICILEKDSHRVRICYR
jgi:hypothetical protein